MSPQKEKKLHEALEYFHEINNWVKAVKDWAFAADDDPSGDLGGPGSNPPPPPPPPPHP